MRCWMPVVQTPSQSMRSETGRTCRNNSRVTLLMHTRNMQDSPQCTNYCCCATLLPFKLRALGEWQQAGKLPVSGTMVKAPTLHVESASLHAIISYMSSSPLKTGEATGDTHYSMMSMYRVLHATG